MRYGLAMILISTSMFLHGMEDDQQSREEEIQLIMAVQLGQVGYVGEWLDMGGNVQAEYAGSFLLEYALRNSNNYAESRTAMFCFLLKRGASPHGHYWGTPLVIEAAAREGYEEELGMLLEYGANPTILDSDGKCAIDHAKSPEAIRLLEDAIARD